MAEKKDRRFKTAEEKHKETVRLKCKVCGQKMVGKSTLSRHISHAHDEMAPVDREKIVIDTYYGHDVVERVIRKFKAGEYKNKAVPIDIGKYLHLAKIKPKEDEKKKKKEDPLKKSEPKKTEIKTDKLFVKIVDLSEKEGRGEEHSKEVTYLGNLLYDGEKERVYLTMTKGKNAALSFKDAMKFIEANKLYDGKLFVLLSNGERYPVKSIEVKDDDEVAGSQVKCTVAYSTEESSK